MKQAIVIEGVSRTRNDLIDGTTGNYDLESGYTCHQIGSGSVTIQLAQPYLINSMRYAYILLKLIKESFHTFWGSSKARARGRLSLLPASR